jgi:hypothetical protein
MSSSTAPVQRLCFESSQKSDSRLVLCPNGNVDGYYFPVKSEKTNRNVLDELHSTQSYEYHKWEMEVPSMNREVRPALIKRSFSESELNGSIDLSLQCKNADLNDKADHSIMEIEPQDEFEFELLESPRANSEDLHRAWLNQRQYRAWMGARNLHIE